MGENLLLALKWPKSMLSIYGDCHIGHLFIPVGQVTQCDPAWVTYSVLTVSGYVSPGVARSPCYLPKTNNLTRRGEQLLVSNQWEEQWDSSGERLRGSLCKPERRGVWVWARSNLILTGLEVDVYTVGSLFLTWVLDFFSLLVTCYWQ